MNEVWAILVPVLITAIATAAVVTGSAMGYFKLKGIAFFDRKTAELKEKQLKEETDRKARMVAEATATALSVKIDPVLEQIATLTESVTIRDQYIKNLQDTVEDLKGDMTVVKTNSTAVENALVSMTSTNQELLIGLQNIDRAIKVSIERYDGSAETILAGVRKALSQTRDNVPEKTKSMMDSPK